ERLPIEGGHETVDAWAVRRGDRLMVLLTNHALPRHPIAAECVRLELVDAPPPRKATLERIDNNHANAKAAWKAMGEPEYLTRDQVQELEAASRLVPEPHPWRYEGRTAHFEIELPPHAAAALTIELPAEGPRQ